MVEKWRELFFDSFSGLDGVSMTYPNFEVELWWTTLIPFVGTPTSTSTKLWEYENFTNKNYAKRSNNRDNEKHAVILVRILIDVVYNRYIDTNSVKK